MFCVPINSAAKSAGKPPCQKAKELGKVCIRAPPNAKPTGHNRSESRDAIPIHHLLNPEDFISHFPIRPNSNSSNPNDDDATQGDQEDSSEPSPWSDEFDRADVFAASAGAELERFDFDSFLGAFGTMGATPWTLEPDMPLLTSPGDQLPLSSSALALEPRAFESRQRLLSTVSNLTTIYPENQNLTSDVYVAIEKITHMELDHCIHLYFENYHRHCPLLHRPSFQALLAPIPLLLSMAALGATYSPDKGRVSLWTSLLDVVEAYIFDCPGLREEFVGSFNLAEAPSEDMLHYQFQILQGAYLMVVVQYFSGNLAGRRRARRQRFSRCFDVARAFGLPTAKHGNFLPLHDEISFQRWIRNECRVRTMNIILSLDAAMGVFNNVPTRANYSELDLELPCHQQYFEFATYLDMTRAGLYPTPRLKLTEAFQRLFLASDQARTAFENENLCFWDMMYLIHVLYTYFWQNTYGNPLIHISGLWAHESTTHPAIQPIKTALANWKMLWDDIRSETNRISTADMGFETTSDSYWTLINLMMQRLETKSKPAINVQGQPTNGSEGHLPPGPSLGDKATSARLDFLPVEADCDSHGSHLRGILGL
ncbi:hypothetical protein PV10_00518 [Exophiala mesophila]|uniref:Xylanolytic transcriptional activator regulatory domain-containing protein n=1 Tax=Exophiala mesophila TaxID=212818 RepID=A0A0D1X4H6_EXOME|nr:uncharacterized protein PV10_00518 [Exophiala mesophila]KIV96685.1 hypothetical protein PV10_00518 [Exophiala mesophila]